MSDDDHIAANIRRARLQRGLTQTAIAKKLEVKQPAVSQWESGHSLPELATRMKLAKLLDLSLGQVGIPVQELRMSSLPDDARPFLENYLALDPAGREVIEKTVEYFATRS